MTCIYVLFVYSHLCLFIFTYIHEYSLVFWYLFIYIHVCICLCIYLFMFICVCIYLILFMSIFIFKQMLCSPLICSTQLSNLQLCHAMPCSALLRSLRLYTTLRESSQSSLVCSFLSTLLYCIILYYTILCPKYTKPKNHELSQNRRPQTKNSMIQCPRPKYPCPSKP